MSQISKALRKAQELRENIPNPQEVFTLPVTEAPAVKSSYVETPPPKKNSMATLAIGTLMAVLISLTALVLVMLIMESKQNKTIALENTIKSQNKKINELISEVNNSKNMTDSQIKKIQKRLNEEHDYVIDRVNGLNANIKDNYNNFKDALIDDKQEIDTFNDLTKRLQQKIESLTVANTQGQTATIPAGSN